MAQSSGFFNAELLNAETMEYDREYLAEHFAKYFSLFIANGVFPNPSDGLQVFENTVPDMNVLVRPGYAWINGYWYALDGDYTLAIDPADGVLNRIDLITLRWDLERREIYLSVTKGTPSSDPQVPELSRSADYYDLCSAQIRINAGTTKITQSMITDTRLNSDLCGIVTGVVQSIDTTTLFEQYQAALKEFQDTRMVEFDEWQEQEKTDFDAWFETIKGTLDGDTAGNLLNLITQETADRKAADLAIESKLGINATATYEESTVKITAPEGLVVVTFLAPSNCNVSDRYTINGDALTLTDLNGETVEDAWKQGAPVTFTISGNKAFFKAGGMGKLPSDLAPLCPNFVVERNGTKVKISADKIQLNPYTNMVSGGVWAWGKTQPTKPTGENTKLWSRAELITTGKPYDGLYLGDVTPSDAVSEVLLWLPENKDGKVVLIPFIILSVDYLGGVYVVRKFVWVASAFGVESVDSYDGSTLDTFMQSYANSVISDEILNEIVEVDYSIFSVSLSGNKTVKRKVITVSAGECNLEGFTDGNKIPRFITPANRIAYDESGQARAYWTRTKQNASSSIGVNTSGNFIGYTTTSSQYTRPSFVLPKDFKVQKRPDGSYTAWTGESGLTWSDLMVSDEVTETIVNILEPKTGMVPTIYLSDDFNESDALLLLRRDVLNVTATGNRYRMVGAGDQYSKSVTYAKIQSWAENDVDPKIIAKKVLTTIKQRSIYYDSGQDKNVYVITSCEAYAFELGNDELGFSAFSEGVCGTKLPYFSSDTRRIAKLDANIKSYNTRDAAVRPLASADSWYIVTVGGTRGSTTSPVNVRPSILISKDVWFNKLADGSYDLIPEDPAPGTQTVSTLAETGTPVQLKDIPVSTAGNAVGIKIPEVDSEQNYVYLVREYEGSNAGALLRQNVTKKGSFASSTTFVNYGGSVIDSYFVDFADSKLDEKVKPYLVNAQVEALGGPYSRSCFALSDNELGDPKFATKYGTPIPYFNSNDSRKSEYSGAASGYWCRNTSATGTGASCAIVLDDGSVNSSFAANANNGYRPVILISLDAWLIDNGDGTYTFAGDEPAPPEQPLSIEIDWPESDPLIARQWVYNQKGVYQTMLMGGIATIEDTPPFEIPLFTGNHVIYGDEVEGRIELYESGDLTLYPGTYDFFLVGGGGSGTRRTDTSVAGQTGGGGGGYTFTQNAVEILTKTDFTVSVGAGGYRAAGSASTIVSADASINYTAAGGGFISSDSVSSYTRGANGGSGGGGGGNSYGGSGGSDGGNGVRGGNPGKSGYGGTGQGTTTRMFGEEGGTLFGGGGGGGGDDSGGAGGAGGGGSGGYGASSHDSGSPGTANTGGGGGGGGQFRTTNIPGQGGSGIIIVRWNNDAQ